MGGKAGDAMRRAIIVCAVVSAICVASSGFAHDLAPGKIVSVGQDTYKIRLPPDTKDDEVDADTRAMKLASDYCTGIKKTMGIVKSKTFDLGYGYTLTWSCVPSQRPPNGH